MLLCYHSWMFDNHFIATLYHFLRLTYWSSAQCQLLFCLFFTSQKINIKRSPNATKLFVEFLCMIRPFCIMLLYWYLLHYVLLLHIISQYLCLFSLISEGLHEEGECRQLEFWTGKGANIRDLFCTTPKVLKPYKKYLAKKEPEGATSQPQGWRVRPTPLGAPPDLVGPLAGLRCPSLAIWCLLPWKKN